MEGHGRTPRGNRVSGWVLHRLARPFASDLTSPLGRIRPARFLIMTGRRRPKAAVRQDGKRPGAAIALVSLQLGGAL